MNNKITFLNNIYDNSKQDLNITTFRDLIRLQSTGDNQEYKDKLVKLGFFRKLEHLERQVIKDIQYGNWDWIKTRPDGLAFLLNDFNTNFVLNFQNKTNSHLSTKDFNPTYRFPEGYIEDLGITKYELIKSLYPGFSFATFKKGEGKRAAAISSHAPFMALDIDLDYDNEKELLTKISKYVDIYCCLTSPSGRVRPVIRINTCRNMMRNLWSWKNGNLPVVNRKLDLHSLFQDYIYVIFDKIEKSLKKETLNVNGIPMPFMLDEKCKNLNRFWYIARDPKRIIQTNPFAKSIEITRKDCIDYSKKKFPPFNDIFDSAA